jgi:hypothetical protein
MTSQNFGSSSIQKQFLLIISELIIVDPDPANRSNTFSLGLLEFESARLIIPIGFCVGFCQLATGRISIYGPLPQQPESFYLAALRIYPNRIRFRGILLL